MAASSLGLPPRPLKKPPPVEAAPLWPEPEPNRPPPDGCCKKGSLVCPKTPPPLACCDWPNTEGPEALPNAAGCPKLKPVEEVVVVVFPPNTEAWPKVPEPGCPKAGVALCPNRPVLLAVLLTLEPKEKELALLAVGAPNSPLPVVLLLDATGAAPGAGEPNPGLAPNVAWPKPKPVFGAGCPKPPACPKVG